MNGSNTGLSTRKLLFMILILCETKISPDFYFQTWTTYYFQLRSRFGLVFTINYLVMFRNQTKSGTNSTVGYRHLGAVSICRKNRKRRRKREDQPEIQRSKHTEDLVIGSECRKGNEIKQENQSSLTFSKTQFVLSRPSPESLHKCVKEPDGTLSF